MSYINPSVSDFKSYFIRDFPYAPSGETDLKYVLDSDIDKAINECINRISESFFNNQLTYTEGFLYLTAHLLYTNLLSASSGISNNSTSLTTSKTVGSVSESYAVPDWMLEHVKTTEFSKSPYGIKYYSLIYAKLVALSFQIAPGTTTSY